MEFNYQEIEEREKKISEWLKVEYLKERLLYSDMAVLLLTSVSPLCRHHSKDNKDKKLNDLALSMLSSRMFNDFEATKHLLLWGLPGQTQSILRDVIECMLLFRLFLKKPERAKKWIISLSEYHPINAYNQLKNLNINAKEYAMYGQLSHEGHTNLLAALSHTQEQYIEGKGTLRTIHFGSAQTPESKFFITDSFQTLFTLFFFALAEPLADCYYHNTEESSFVLWHQKLEDIRQRIVDLTNEYIDKPNFGTSKVTPELQDLISRKIRFKDFKRILES